MSLAPFIEQSFVVQVATECYLEWYDSVSLRLTTERVLAYKFDSARMAQRMAQKVNREYPVKFKWSVVPA